MLASEADGYACPMREFYRWTDAPQQPPSSPVLASIAVVWCAGLPWFREQELLALFGLTTIDHPDRILSRVLGARFCPTTRLFYATAKEELLMGRQRAGPGLEILLSPDGAAALMSVLIARPLAPGCPMSIALVHATERLAVEAREAMTAAGRPLELASTLCNLAAEALSVLTVDEAMDARLTHGLTSLAGQLGRVVRPRNSAAATQAVKNSARDLTPAALARFSLQSYVDKVEPVSRAFLAEAMNLASAALPHREPKPSAMQNIAASKRRMATRRAALATASDALLRSTNGRFISPFFHMLSQDILTVTGTRFCRLPSLVCSALHLRTV